jgi:hypothetical protein
MIAPWDICMHIPEEFDNFELHNTNKFYNHNCLNNLPDHQL